MKGTLLAIFLLSASVAHADPLVVADDACPRYAVDIAAFATCDGDQAASLNRAAVAPALLAEADVPVGKRNRTGLYLDARGAYRLKHDNPQRIVLIDVRARAEVGLTGQPADVDMHVPYLETEIPLRWDEDLGGWAMTRNPTFANEVAQHLSRLGVPFDAPLIVLCRAGERSAPAADELAAMGYRTALSVVDGFEGDVAPDGRRSINGWKNAGLPWTARPLAALVYGAR